MPEEDIATEEVASDVESIEVVKSEEDGNVPAESLTDKPIVDQTTEEVVEEKKETEPELFELPDGRKVDAVTLSREWKENFMPDYTHKSQALKEIEKNNTKETPSDPLADPNYAPQSYAELAQQIEARTLARIENENKARAEQRQALEDAVSNSIAELKKADPSLNENSLFLHANKYGFRDLKAAYQNMQDMNALVKKTQATTAANIAKRTDPVSVAPGGGGGAKPDPGMFENAREYLRSLK